MVMVKVGGVFHGWSLYIGHVLDFDTRIKKERHIPLRSSAARTFDTFLACSICLVLH